MKYPYIGKGSRSGAVFLFFKESEALVLDSGSSAYFGCVNNICETLCRNITAEYLANTYGEVKSKEHAEFIIKLSGGGSSSISNLWSQSLKFFVIDSDGKVSFGSRVYHQEKVGKREITIPLPPDGEKSTVSGYGQVGEGFIHKQSDSESPDDEWPKVGSIVTWGTKAINGEVKGIDGDLAWVRNDHGNHNTVHISDLEKPKTPEEKMFAEISDKIKIGLKSDLISTDHLSAAIANVLMRDYNITKKPQ